MIHKKSAIGQCDQLVLHHNAVRGKPTVKKARWGVEKLDPGRARLSRGNRPGMHRSEKGALAVTALRAQDLNGHSNTFWTNLTLSV